MDEATGIATTLEPPYYAVIFTSIRTNNDTGYEEAAARMVELASEQPGYLGIESVAEDGLAITVSYWSSEEALIRWKRQLEHRQAQATGRAKWYSQYTVRVARVERAYGFTAASESGVSASGAEGL